jgi:iron complex transport system permease protein
MPETCKKRRARVAILLLAATVLVAGFASLAAGSVAIPIGEISGRLWDFLRGTGNGDATGRILFSTRLPRILTAVLAGGVMGMAGLASQTLFRNPLASPYVTGVANGAAVGAVAGVLLCGDLIGFAAVPLLGVVGGLVAAGAVYGIARSSRHGFGQSILLAGIAISACGSALTSGALYLAGERLQTLVFWLMGGLWQAGWCEVQILLPLFGACFLALFMLAPAMNVALAGERSAHDLGVNIHRLQAWLLLIVAVGTAVVVSLTGVIGFVGLVIPHLLRLLLGGDHRVLASACALGGALLLLGADTLARTIAAPAEVPVGILTALVGAPVFLWLLLRRKGGVAA